MLEDPAASPQVVPDQIAPRCKKGITASQGPIRCQLARVTWEHNVPENPILNYTNTCTKYTKHIVKDIQRYTGRPGTDPGAGPGGAAPPPLGSLYILVIFVYLQYILI